MSINKDELIREARELLRLNLHSDDYVYEMLANAVNMLSRSIVWQEGEPPNDFLLSKRCRILIDTGHKIYLETEWPNEEWENVIITRHAILTPPQKIDWPGESPLELTPEQEEACEKALEKSEKYMEPNHDND